MDAVSVHVMRTPSSGWIQRHDDDAPLVKKEDEAKKEIEGAQDGKEKKETTDVKVPESDKEKKEVSNTKEKDKEKDDKKVVKDTKDKGEEKKGPVALRHAALDVAFAHKSILHHFGGEITGMVRTGKITICATQDDLYTAFDG